ncbi:trace amine-associated receptor 13c-like [Anguilla rostrata]|uniref:trace amine-associated receptor 13c-like n=1 Tax=Anguilla rostrata TaxID=7938 RepID=UPI0030CBB377
MNFTEDHQWKSCVNSSNLTCLGATPILSDALLYLSVAAVVFVTVCGNLLVIISICHFKQLHTPTNFLLLSLAVADFLVGATVMPFHFIMLIDPDWCIGELYCAINNVVSYSLTGVSINSVVFIAVDRFFALSSPFLYCTKMTGKLTLRIILILWLYTFIYNVALLYSNGNIPEMKENTTCVDCIVIIDEIWAITDFLIVLVLPCITIMIIYVKIFYIAKKHANNITCVMKQHTNSRKVNNYSMASERKAAKTLSILVVVFLLCLVPCFASVFVDVYVKKPSVYLSVLITLTLLYVNSSLNPIIYALFYPWFQKSVKLILTLRICGTESSLMNVFIKET